MTSKQITYAAAVMIIGTSIQTKQLYTIMRQESWIAVISAFVICLVLFQIYASLAKRFPGLSLIEINDIVFGRLGGKLVSAVYIFYFLTVACLNVNIMGTFIGGYVLPGTPTVYVLALFVFVCAWAVYKGPAKLMRYGWLLTAFSMVILLLITSLLIPNIKLKNLMPFFTLPTVKYAVGIHSTALIPLCDPFFLLMYLPYVKKPSGFGSAIRKGLFIGILFMLVIIIRDPSVLGPSLGNMTLPSLIAIRMIDVGDVLTRIDIVYFVIITMLVFYKVVLLFYAAVTGLRRFLKTSSEKSLINVLAVLLVLYALIVFRSSGEHSEWLSSGGAHFLHTFILVVLPLVTLITAALRGMTKEAALASAAADYNITGGGPA